MACNIQDGDDVEKTYSKKKGKGEQRECQEHARENNKPDKLNKIVVNATNPNDIFTPPASTIREMVNMRTVTIYKIYSVSRQNISYVLV